jgi:hypothetical protein
MGGYAKAIVAVIGAGVAALQLALDDGVIVGQEWTAIVIAVVTAIGVYLVPNAPK